MFKLGVITAAVTASIFGGQSASLVVRVDVQNPLTSTNLTVATEAPEVSLPTEIKVPLWETLPDECPITNPMMFMPGCHNGQVAFDRGNPQYCPDPDDPNRVEYCGEPPCHITEFCLEDPTIPIPNPEPEPEPEPAPESLPFDNGSPQYCPDPNDPNRANLCGWRT
jgi:hypothetical protein